MAPLDPLVSPEVAGDTLVEGEIAIFCIWVIEMVGPWPIPPQEVSVAIRQRRGGEVVIGRGQVMQNPPLESLGDDGVKVVVGGLRLSRGAQHFTDQKTVSWREKHPSERNGPLQTALIHSVFGAQNHVLDAGNAECQVRSATVGLRRHAGGVQERMRRVAERDTI